MKILFSLFLIDAIFAIVFAPSSKIVKIGKNGVNLQHVLRILVGRKRQMEMSFY